MPFLLQRDSFVHQLLLRETCGTFSFVIPPLFFNPGLAKLITEFLLDTSIIVRDPSIPRPPKEGDAVKRRIEAALLSEST
jgi:hypothetical protein